MQLDFHQVDAFSKHAFRGNPAMVYRLDAWLGDELMQQIAAEHNLAETAFMVKEGSHWHIRWFTPAAEVPLSQSRRCMARSLTGLGRQGNRVAKREQGRSIRGIDWALSDHRDLRLFLARRIDSTSPVPSQTLTANPRAPKRETPKTRGGAFMLQMMAEPRKTAEEISPRTSRSAVFPSLRWSM